MADRKWVWACRVGDRRSWSGLHQMGGEHGCWSWNWSPMGHVQTRWCSWSNSKFFLNALSFHFSFPVALSFFFFFFFCPAVVTDDSLLQLLGGVYMVRSHRVDINMSLCVYKAQLYHLTEPFTWLSFCFIELSVPFLLVSAFSFMNHDLFEISTDWKWC